MRHRSNYDWLLFLTSPMAFFRFKPITLCSNSLDHGCSLTLTLMFNIKQSPTWMGSVFVWRCFPYSSHQPFMWPSNWLLTWPSLLFVVALRLNKTFQRPVLGLKHSLRFTTGCYGLEWLIYNSMTLCHAERIRISKVVLSESLLKRPSANCFN